MTSITHTEREDYSTLWQSVPDYGTNSPAEMFLPAFFDMTGAKAGATVLDAGCGSGKGGVALSASGFDVTLFDLTDDGLTEQARALPFLQGSVWHEAPSWRQYDYVLCCDVMEHLPTPFTMLAAHHLLSASLHGVFFSISLVQDSYGMWLGRHLHQTVQSFVWWRDHLSELGHVKECRDLHNVGLYWVTPR